MAILGSFSSQSSLFGNLGVKIRDCSCFGDHIRELLQRFWDHLRENLFHVTHAYQPNVCEFPLGPRVYGIRVDVTWKVSDRNEVQIIEVTMSIL